MAAPARTPPAGNTTDSSDILAAILELGERMERRFAKVETDIAKLETGLGKVETGLAKVETGLAKLDERQRKQSEDIARIEGRLTGVEGMLRQIPTHWQLTGLIFAIFTGSFVLIRFAGGH
jgi:septal ring factor EnvC (AmiA/AmiB activator)